MPEGALGAVSAARHLHHQPIAPSRAQMLAIETVARSIQAEHLQTNLDGAEWVDPGEKASEAAARLQSRDFDQAPAGQPGHLAGYVLTLDLMAAEDQLASAVLRVLDADHVVSSRASVLEVLEALEAAGPMAFVVDGRNVNGFVTAPDLNKHPARIHFYLLLTSLEVALAAWVRDVYPDLNEAALALGAGAKRVRSRFRRDQRNNVEVDLVTGMDLQDLLIITGSRPAGRQRFGARAFHSWEEWQTALASLRNAVMHPVLNFLGPERTLGDLLELEKSLREVLAHTDETG